MQFTLMTFLLFTQIAISDSKLDEEIIQNLDFFMDMEVIAEIDLLENEDLSQKLEAHSGDEKSEQGTGSEDNDN